VYADVERGDAVGVAEGTTVRMEERVMAQKLPVQSEKEEVDAEMAK